jgi:hypothetical protein
VYATDASGLPTAWSAGIQMVDAASFVSGPNYFMATTFASDYGVGDPRSWQDMIVLRDAHDGTPTVTYSGSNQDKPGTWDVTTVPEPASGLLIAAGWGVLRIVKRRRRRMAKRQDDLVA